MKHGIDIGNDTVNTSENIRFKACISNHKEFGSCCDKLVYEGKAHYIGRAPAYRFERVQDKQPKRRGGFRLAALPAVDAGNDPSEPTAPYKLRPAKHRAFFLPARFPHC